MTPWYLNKKNLIHSISGECCSTTQLMSHIDENGVREYALVQYSHGEHHLKAIWHDDKVTYPVVP